MRRTRMRIKTVMVVARVVKVELLRAPRLSYWR